MDILIRPLVTEKVTAFNEKGKYGFIVEKKANKIEIKKAVEKIIKGIVFTERAAVELTKNRTAPFDGLDGADVDNTLADGLSEFAEAFRHSRRSLGWNRKGTRYNHNQ